ncbi:hypothetical protein TCAL_12899 [Tigriopus californicus]|uniref:UBA domain-containing protein n=1 Tax=Tigriopus californicus TaxID=6832 RepID=A0A553NU41_TIGCA|nr:ubiquitin-associated protein 1-like [Tigriopus californicus]TRY68955.1 hypothetical protein TCAL_12899 [Tigriopus californicus]|eukprot:TCALIF_12899-PA protein Name:"Protein of unknown function" AED:0.20 eAED:0.26 QI:0/-1/0/1/-1/1/1/0/491
MAQSAHFRDLETDLDALGFHPLAHVPFQLHPALRAAHSDQLERRVAATLQDPSLSQLEADLAGGLWDYDPSLEHQVLDTLRQRADQEQQRVTRQAQQWHDYQAQKQRDQAERQASVTQAQAQAENQAASQAESTTQLEGQLDPEVQLTNGHQTGAGSTAIEVVEPERPGLNVAPPVGSVAGPPVGPWPRPVQPINFSEFEAESDPFESLALKSMNDYQELAAVLQTSTQLTPSAQSVASGPAHPPASYARPFNPPTATGVFPRATFPTPPDFFNYFPPAQPSPTYFPSRLPPYRPAPAPAPPPGAEPTVKNSQSFGDILNEIKKEAQADVRKKSSQTPPPRPANVPGSTSKLTDWIPWPDLDGTPCRPSPAEDPLALISDPDQRRLCQQIHDMGFPLARVARVCAALKDKTGQNIINFCLLVDKFIGESGLPEEEVEYVLHLKSAEETKVRPHLKAFRSLKELGFSSKDIHHALVECDTDHDKALEKLLKT